MHHSPWSDIGHSLVYYNIFPGSQTENQMGKQILILIIFFLT